MSLTGTQLLTGLSTFMGDSWSSTTTSAGATDGTTVKDTKLSRMGDDYYKGWYVRLTSGTSTLQSRRVTTFSKSSGTLEVLPAFSAQVATSVTYELHRYDPEGKFTALDEARMRAYPELARIVFDDTSTADGISSEFDIPSTIRRGPAFVFGETPRARDVQWNFITTPLNDATTGWTATNATATTYERNANDLLVPKFGSECVKLTVAASTNGTYKQVVGDMANDATAALVADRPTLFAMWVYCTEASRVTLKITDDTDTTTGTAHAGRGWELITVAKTIMGSNATTLTVTLDVASGSTAMTIYLDGSWFYLGNANRVTDIYWDKFLKRIRRDDTTQKVVLDEVPVRGTQLRFVGRQVLSALGTVAATQVTNTMEVDEPAAQLLYAEAANIIFERDLMITSMPDEMAVRVSTVRTKRDEYAVKWPFKMPAGANLRGWLW